MPDRIPQTVAIRVPLKAYLSSDHVSNAAGKTIAMVISKNGAAFGNPSAGAINATEIGSGWYYVDLSTADANALGPLIVRGTAAGVDDVETVYQVVDANSMGAAYLDAAVSSRNATTPPTVAQIRVEMDSNSVKLANLDATVSSRSTYAGADTAGTTTLLSRLTAQRATNLDNLDATVSSRSTYAGLDTPGTTTLLTRLTPARAANLDNLDVAVSTRSTYSGADSPGTATLLSRIPGTVQPQTGDSFARLGAPTGGTVSADVGAVKADTGGLRTDYTSARAARLDNLDAPVSGTAAAVWITANRTLTAFSFSVVASNSLTAQQTADAVWNEPTSAHTIPGSTGVALTSKGSGGSVIIAGTPLTGTLAGKQQFSASLSQPNPPGSAKKRKL
jgi:hypothetical protein